MQIRFIGFGSKNDTACTKSVINGILIRSANGLRIATNNPKIIKVDPKINNALSNRLVKSIDCFLIFFIKITCYKFS